MQAGFENWYFAGCTIIHFKGESSRKGSLHHTRMFYKAMAVFVQKHYRGKRSAALKRVLMAGIRFRAAWALVTGARRKRPVQAQAPSKILVAGSEAEYQECRLLLERAGTSLQLVRWTPNTGGDPSMQARELKEFCEEHKINEIIFCQGLLAYSHIIGWVQALGDHFRFYFHATGSNSIVSSASNTHQGEVIAAG